MINNVKTFASVLMPGVVHMRHTHLPEHKFVSGQPETGAELANDLERICTNFGGENIAACIVEPVAGSTGTLVPPKGYLQRLREICDKHGIPLIFDEVVSGFRFSPGGAQQLYGVVPDLTCLAKVLAGGMPGGAVAGRAEIMALFDITGEAHHDRHQRVVHLGTFTAAPLSAAAGIATLRQIATGEPVAQANAMAERLRTGWNAILEDLGIAGYAYGPCSTFHVYFETDPQPVARASDRSDLYTGDAARLKGMPGDLILEYQRLLRKHGVDIMSLTGGVVSAAHTPEDIDQACEAFDLAMRELREQRLVATLS